jgi:hypothetical protein
MIPLVSPCPSAWIREALKGPSWNLILGSFTNIDQHILILVKS